MMDPFKNGEDHEPLQVLRLHKWTQAPLPISSFDEASLSPCRDILSLHSKDGELMLVPLRSVSQTIPGISSVPPPPPPPTVNVPNTTSQTKGSSRLAVAGHSTTSGPVTSPYEGEISSSNDSLSTNARHFPSIADAVSYCWGCNGDGYCTDKHVVLFRELLFVVGSEGLFVHAFARETSKQESSGSVIHSFHREQSPESFVRGKKRTVSGRWMNWGRVDTDPSSVTGDHFPGNGSMDKNFVTCLMDAQVQKSAAGIELNFVGDFHTPNRRIVSFNISYQSLAFSALAELCEEYQQRSPGSSTPIFGPATEGQLVNSNLLQAYKFSKVFAGPSYDVLGMALLKRDLADNALTDHGEGKLFVLICKVLHSGLMWSSVVKPGQGVTYHRADQWVAFTISRRNLIGLHEKGIACIWSLSDGKILVEIDVLRHCGLSFTDIEGTGPTLQTDLPEQEMSELNATDAKGTQKSKNGDVLSGQSYAHSRSFTQLAVDADCSLLSVMDSSGIVYLVSTKSYLSGSPQCKGGLPYEYLSPWGVASADIGFHLPVAYLAPDSQSKDLQTKRPGNKILGCSGGVLSSCSSGFSSKLDLTRAGLHTARFKRNSCQPLRNIILPVNYMAPHNTFSLSRLGITQMLQFEDKGQSSKLLVFRMLCLPGKFYDDNQFNSKSSSCVPTEEELDCLQDGKVIIFHSQGCLHYVSEVGLYVVLPPWSLHTSQKEAVLQGRWWFTGATSKCSLMDLQLGSHNKKEGVRLQDWQLDVLDKALIYDGLNEAEHLAVENGWCQQVVRLRRLQLALHYSQLDEIEQALDGLVPVGAAEIGVPRLLFAALELMLNKCGGDNELGLASRLLYLAAQFATKLIYQYGARMTGEKALKLQGKLSKKLNCSLVSNQNCGKNLQEMSRYLEIIRKLQNQLQLRRSPQPPGKKDTSDDFETDGISNDKAAGSEEAVETGYSVVSSNMGDLMWLVKSGAGIENQESSGEMFYRWQKQKVELSDIVREALKVGRLPLAVVQLHRLQLKDFASQAQRQNAFKEVQGIGRAFVYDLFCKGETTKAMTVLSRLGEDPEIVLRELAFGTLSRYLRSQVVRELARLDCLNSQDILLLETVSVLERAYPNSSFWGSYGAQQRLLPGPTGNAANESPTNIKLQITCSLKAPMDLVISCGEVDGVVLGCWDGTHDLESVPSVLDESVQGYWAAAAVWLSEWDQKTLDRVILDQATRTGDGVSWEAHLQNAISRHDWAEVSSLLDWIPGSVLQEGELRVRLDCSDKLDLYVSQLNAERDLDERGLRNGLDGLEVDSVDLLIPRVKILAVSLGNACTGWMYQMMEEKLAQKFIFLCSNWHGTSKLISLLARAGMLFENVPKLSLYNRSSSQRRLYNEATHAVHELVLHHCVRHSLPNLMGIYLDHHSLARDNVSSVVMQAVVGDCQWALWLLFSRIKGREYDASFANARTILAHNFSPQQLSATVDVDDFILTVDDMAMVGGEMMALSTLMYAPVPLEKCLCTGSVNRHDGPTWQCTLENLRPGLQQFPTLWRTLVAACFSPDMWCFTTSFISSAASMARNKMGLAGYLQWREQLFSSACGDTSLLQMLPRWYPKGVRRLLQLAVQGPVGGGQSLIQGGNDLMLHSGMTTNDLDPMSWESSVQKSIEEELYASSKFEDNAKGVEHHLRRGRAMAAFNALLGLRLQNLSAQGSMIREHVGKFQRGQMHMASDMHAVLSPLTLHEEKFLASVLPLAVVNFENPVVVAACASFLELCGLPATMLRIDIAALNRISAYCKAKEQDALYGTGAKASLAEAQDDWPNFCRNDITSSLARALADEYAETGVAVLSLKKSDVSGKRLSAGKLNRTLLKILEMLEKASYMELPKQESTPGSWLLNGIGDGPQLRAQQREASERWSLVTTFCNVHQLPISTVYLAALAKDNDWVGFLAEAQLEGCPLDMLISVATTEFTDTRLRSHILTVLKSSQAAWQKQSPPLSTTPSALHFDRLRASAAMYRSELFDILADCEHKRHPGTALLVKAKDLRWPLLAVVASCFSDTTPVSCLTVWLEITAARETSLIKVNDAAAHIAACVGAAVEATNLLTNSSHSVEFRYNRKIAKRRRFSSPEKTERDSSGSTVEPKESPQSGHAIGKDSSLHGGKPAQDPKQKPHHVTNGSLPHDGLEEQESLSRMIAILCEQKLFFPLLKAFELFMPSSPLLPFIRFLQAFSQMRLSEASAHLTSFSASLKEESHQASHAQSRNRSSTAWISTAAVTAADTMLTTCPSAYECRCLLQLLAGADFGDGGVASARFRHLYWKIQFAEPAFQQGRESVAMGVNLDDNELLSALEKHGKWEEARSWARQLELTGQHGKAAMHHVTETQAEAMVAEWKEYIWDIPEERMALWNHCQTLFIRFSFPPLQAGSFFLKHAEAIEQEISPAELHGILLLALQWLSGSITHTSPVYPLHLLRELETRIWLLAVESQVETLEGGGRKSIIRNYPVLASQKLGQDVMATSGPDYINLTAKAVAAVDNHLKNSRLRSADLNTNERDGSVQTRPSAQQDQASPSATAGGVSKLKRRPKNYALHKRIHFERSGKLPAEQEGNAMTNGSPLRKVEPKGTTVLQEEPKEDPAAGEDQIYWEERVGEQELERAVLSLLEVGQVSAARQLQQKLAPAHVPIELLLVEAALSMAMISTPTVKGSVDSSTLHPSVTECLLSSSFIDDISTASPLELLEALTKICREGCGRGICKRIIAIAQVAEFLEMSFSEAFEKQPTQLLQLLSLKAQDSFAEATLLVETHSMPAASIARILAESFLKGLLAAHRGGYMESSLREEGPAPLLWRPSDLLKWAKLCPSEPELGHALMRIVISGHDVPHACEVELLILAHHFYMSSACLDGIDVLLALAATRVESYISEGDFVSLARLVTGINNFQALHFMLDILIENGQLELLLQKRAAVEAAMESSASVRGFRMAVLSTLKHFNPHDLDAFAMVYDQFDMKHEMARLLESRARKVLEQWLVQHDPEQSEDLLEMMRFNVEAAEVWSGVDAGNKARWNCAQASLISLQLRMPEIMWLSLSDTNARRLFVEQSRFQEALVVAEAYKLNQPGEWVPVLWNQMLHPGFDQFLGEFVAALPLPPSMLMELARFYRAEVTARGDQLDFSTWLSPGVMPLEWARFLGKSFRCLLKYVRDVRLRVQLATLATGFPDVLDVCMRILDKVPETAGPLIVRKGHGGTYLPLM